MPDLFLYIITCNCTSTSHHFLPFLKRPKSPLPYQICLFPKIMIPQNGWFTMENLLKWLIWGYPYFWFNTHMFVVVCVSTLLPGHIGFNNIHYRAHTFPEEWNNHGHSNTPCCWCWCFGGFQWKEILQGIYKHKIFPWNNMANRLTISIHPQQRGTHTRAWILEILCLFT